MAVNLENHDLKLGDLPVYQVFPADGQAHPGLVLIHEIWGLNEHTRAVAERYAAEGFNVIAPNLIHGQPFEGKVDPTLLNQMQDPDPAVRDQAQKQMRAVIAPVSAPKYATQALAELRRCVDELADDPAVQGGIAVLGFCFGGSYAFHLAAGDDRVKAAVPYYGQAPEADEIAKITCPVLAFYGDQDEPLMGSLPGLKDGMRAAGKDFEAVVYPGAAHAFFNDTNPRRYNQQAAEDSWGRALKFLRAHLG